MRPFDVKLNYLGQPWCTVRLEVGYDEIGDADVAESDVDYVQVRRVCRRLFAYRRLQSWPPVVIKGERWGEMHKSESEGLHVLSAADEAVAWVNDLIATIESTGATVGGVVGNREDAAS